MRLFHTRALYSIIIQRIVDYGWYINIHEMKIKV